MFPCSPWLILYHDPGTDLHPPQTGKHLISCRSLPGRPTLPVTLIFTNLHPPAGLLFTISALLHAHAPPHHTPPLNLNSPSIVPSECVIPSLSMVLVPTLWLIPSTLQPTNTVPDIPLKSLQMLYYNYKFLVIICLYSHPWNLPPPTLVPDS